MSASASAPTPRGAAPGAREWPEATDPYTGHPADRWRMVVDRAGWCVRLIRVGHQPGEVNFAAAMEHTRTEYPLEDDAIVRPTGWRYHEDGRGLSVLEMQQLNATAAAP